ncbi:hypothetical protein Poli38472_012285 [Pythium oligandrum]|uniref:Ankyrin n=1 Tax=Pythium oligandrum TaxID=41045 RepID=A0A8K1FNC3_PYTOL|nr:hypothetical protein Poli38472_012285 [Pythium oligandrum]|eukprot:TMW67169.1 hypothetical protein Poli38472_012285 [Pythium oligandrum]
MEEFPQRALFQAAVERDVDAVRVFFAQPSVASAVARSNADHRRTREIALALDESPFCETFRFHHAPRNWYTYFPSDRSDELRGFLFHLIIHHERLEVLQWFLSAEACEVVADTMRGVLDHLSANVIRMRGRDNTDVLELIFESYLFVEVLSPIERKHALQDLMDQAILHNRPDLIRFIVAHGVEVNGFFSRVAPLEYCASTGSTGSVKKLVESGVFGVLYNQLGRSVSFRNSEVTRALLASGVDMRGVPGRWTPLHTAVKEREMDIVETLVVHALVDVNARMVGGSTALMDCVSDDIWSDSGFPIVVFLLENGADAQLRTRTGTTAIHFAATSEVVNEKTLDLLLKHGPDLINAQDDEGTTPLLSMVQPYSFSFAIDDLDAMLSRGADPYLANSRGETAYKELMKDARGRAYVASRPHFFPSQEGDN